MPCGLALCVNSLVLLGFEVYWVGRWWLDWTSLFHKLEQGFTTESFVKEQGPVQQPEMTEREKEVFS